MEKLKKEKSSKGVNRILWSKLHKKKSGTLNGIVAAKLVGLLIDEIAEISSVREWAKKGEISESSLYRIISEGFEKTPGEIFREVRYENVLLLLKHDIKSGAYSLAIDSGFRSEDTLRMFLRRQYNTNISQIRFKMLSGSFYVNWKWMNVKG